MSRVQGSLYARLAIYRVSAVEPRRGGPGYPLCVMLPFAGFEPAAGPGPLLSQAQIETFKDQGYVIGARQLAAQ